MPAHSVQCRHLPHIWNFQSEGHENEWCVVWKAASHQFQNHDRRELFPEWQTEVGPNLCFEDRSQVCQLECGSADLNRHRCGYQHQKGVLDFQLRSYIQEACTGLQLQTPSWELMGRQTIQTKTQSHLHAGCCGNQEKQIPHMQPSEGSDAVQ